MFSYSNTIMIWTAFHYTDLDPDSYCSIYESVSRSEIFHWQFCLNTYSLSSFCIFSVLGLVRPIVLRLNGNSDIGAHVRAITVIWTGQGIRSKAAIYRIFFSLTCETCSELPSHINTMARLKTEGHTKMHLARN